MSDGPHFLKLPFSETKHRGTSRHTIIPGPRNLRNFFSPSRASTNFLATLPFSLLPLGGPSPPTTIPSLIIPFPSGESPSIASSSRSGSLSSLRRNTRELAMPLRSALVVSAAASEGGDWFMPVPSGSSVREGQFIFVHVLYLGSISRYLRWFPLRYSNGVIY